MYYAQKRSLKHRLKFTIKKIIGIIAAIIPLSFLIKISRQRVFLPFYHIVSEKPVCHVEHLYSIPTPEKFEKDLDYLLLYFKPVSLNELIDIHTKKVPYPFKPVMHLSFDDGLKECAEIIAPILLKKGIPATFFINSAFVDNKNLMFRYKQSLFIQHCQTLSPHEITSYLIPEMNKNGLPVDNDPIKFISSLRYEDNELLEKIGNCMPFVNYVQYLEDEKPYMSSEQIKWLLDKGFSIGSHSIDHPLYAVINLEEQLRQTIESQKFLEENFNVPNRTFAFPFSDDGLKKEFFVTLNEQLPFDLTFGGAGLKNDSISNNLQRFPMETEKYISVKKRIHTEYLYFMIKSIFKKNIIFRN